MQVYTEMNEFKRALYSFKGFSKDQIESNTRVEQIHNAIKRLLNDELMMKNKNNYTFQERTYITKINLYQDYLFLLEDIREIEAEVEQLGKILKCSTASVSFDERK